MSLGLRRSENMNGDTITRMDIAFTGSVEVSHWKFDKLKPLKSVVISMPGNMGNRTCSLGLRLNYLNMGIEFVAMDSNYSSNEPDETKRICTYGLEEQKTLAEVVDYFCNEGYRVGIIGHSAGAAAAAMMAGSPSNRASAVVLCGLFTNLKEESGDYVASFISDKCHGLPTPSVGKKLIGSAAQYASKHAHGLDIASCNPEEALSRVAANLPVLIVHASNDDFVPVTHAERNITSCSSKIKHLHVFDGDRHDKRPDHVNLLIAQFMYDSLVLDEPVTFLDFFHKKGLDAVLDASNRQFKVSNNHSDDRATISERFIDYQGAKINDLEFQYEKLQAEHNDLYEKYKDSKFEIKNLKAKLDVVQAENRDLKLQFNSFLERFDKLESRANNFSVQEEVEKTTHKLVTKAGGITQWLKQLMTRGSPMTQSCGQQMSPGGPGTSSRG